MTRIDCSTENCSNWLYILDVDTSDLASYFPYYLLKGVYFNLSYGDKFGIESEFSAFGKFNFPTLKAEVSNAEIYADEEMRKPAFFGHKITLGWRTEYTETKSYFAPNGKYFTLRELVEVVLSFVALVWTEIGERPHVAFEGFLLDDEAEVFYPTFAS